MFDLEFIQDYLYGLNQKEAIRIIVVYFVFFGLVVGFLFFRHFNLLHDIQEKSKLLNKARQEIQVVLTEYDNLKNKKNEVDQILLKDKNFYLVKYYQDTIQNSSITNKTCSALVVQTGPAGYDEESLQIGFSQITMKQLCEFIESVQGNHRVFVKNLDITKGPVPKKINANLTIATFKLVAEKTSK